MEKIYSLDIIKSQIIEIRNLKKGFLTNFYFDELKHSLWIVKNTFFYERIGDALFLIKDNGTFMNVFYVSTDVETLKEGLAMISVAHSADTMMFDIVGREKECEALLKLFKSFNYSNYCSLMRMSKLTEPLEYNKDESVVFASISDVPFVSDILNNNFDVKSEQIPYMEELNEYARNRRILIFKDVSVIVGVVIFELSKVNLYLRYWWVNPTYRDKGVGSKLLHRYFNEGRNTKREELWVVATNDNAIAKYEHYGYKKDNMIDLVLCNKNLKHKI